MSTAPTAQEQFDEKASNTLAAVYLTPDVVEQREQAGGLLEADAQLLGVFAGAALSLRPAHAQAPADRGDADDLK